MRKYLIILAASLCVCLTGGIHTQRDSDYFIGGIAFGGTITTYHQSGHIYRAHTFTSSGTFHPHGRPFDVLVVGGGGGAGGPGNVSHSAVGGAGGMLSFVGVTAFNELTVTVGSGGSYRGNSGEYGLRGYKGGGSSVGGLSVEGGGGGGGSHSSNATTGGDGGSGGAGGYAHLNFLFLAGGSGIAGQGASGNPQYPFPEYLGGYGGGASGVSAAGRTSNYSGTSILYSVGGITGTVNSGNGAQGYNNGSSGIVIIRYRIN